MGYQPWHLAAMEEAGYMDTSEGLVNRVVRELAKSPNDEIGRAELRRVCIKCGVDPDSLTSADLSGLQKELNQIT